MDNRPDPWDNCPAKEELNESENEGVGMESLLVEAGGDHGANSGEEDVEDEENDVHRWVHFHNCKLAGAHCLGDFGVGHILILLS